ncbi:unnamed protein product [Darwinula stevensoni]|uniref:Ig-like domain-containing protein n=1 Tax=Darwinula stevensoni TaxID=69355 RepID=A0A7R9AHJ5_9CRUS|nr:unnamed protein product [Darwinula stevensoni]CAG0905287.1 unnamed protein product [Darwinula stevensoni]
MYCIERFLLHLTAAPRHSRNPLSAKASHPTPRLTDRPQNRSPDPPVCKDEERPIVYGVAKMEEAFVTCRVEAEPPPTRFRWAFNNSATTLEIQAKNYNSTGLASTVRYRPQNELDYGSLLCWASNELGNQAYPCVYHVIAVGVPEPPLDCTIVNLTTESIQVTCREGFNGGLKQQFVLEVYEEERRQLWANVSNTKPSFVINGLSPGTTVSLSVYSVNAKGQSEKVFLDASTQKNAGQVLARPDSLMRSLTLNSLLPVLVGVASGLALVAIVIVIMMKMKGHSSRSRRGRRRSRGSDDNKPVAPGIPVYNPVEGLMKSDDPYELDEKNPDLIPQGSVTLECPGRPLQVEMLNHKERRHVSFCEHHTFLPSCSNEYLPNASSPSPNHIWLKNPEEGGISSTAASASAFMSLPRNYTSTPLLQRPDPVVAYATLDRTPRIPPPRGFGNHPDDPHPPKRRGSDQVESTV